jgi:hypothetical protein
MSEPPKEGEDKRFNGSCMVAKAATKQEVLDELQKDIYAKEEVWDLDRVQILPVSPRRFMGSDHVFA